MDVREREARWALGPEMEAEGWTPAGDSLMWLHPPSFRVLVVRPSVMGDDLSPWHVICQVFDESSNPSEAPGDASQSTLPSLARALLFARAVRRSILADRKDISLTEQLDLFNEAHP